MRRLHALVVTFEREAQLTQTLGAIDRQTLVPDTVTLVDNSVRAPTRSTTHPSVTSVIRTGDNLGPAGGLALGVRAILEHAGDGDWVVFVDDDDPPLHDEVFAQLWDYAAGCLERELMVGAVGAAGGRFSRRSGRLSRVPDGDLVDDVHLDYLGGGQFPMYRAEALRAVGGPRAELFFGFDDLDLGLRLQDHGFQVFAPGPVWRDIRRQLGRTGLTPREAAGARSTTAWRRYYSSRNLIDISRRHGHWTAAVVATARYGAVRALVDATRTRSWRSAWPPLRGAVDAWRRRLGRRVTPT